MDETLNSKKSESWFESFKLATFKDGFIVGGFLALILQLGVIKITTELQQGIVYFLLLIGIILAAIQPFKRKSIIPTPWAGLISGFGVVIGFFELVLNRVA